MSLRFVINPTNPPTIPASGVLFLEQSGQPLQQVSELNVPRTPFAFSLVNDTEANYQLSTKSVTGEASPVTGLIFPAGHTTTIDGFDITAYGTDNLFLKRSDSDQEWSFVPSNAMTQILQGSNNGVDPCKRLGSAPSAPTSAPSAPITQAVADAAKTAAPVVEAAVAAEVVNAARRDNSVLSDTTKQVLTIKAVCDKSANCSTYWIGWIILVIIFFILTWAFYQVGKYELWAATLISALIVFVFVGWILTMGVPKACQDVAGINALLSGITLLIFVILGVIVVVSSGLRKCHDGVVYDDGVMGAEHGHEMTTT